MYFQYAMYLTFCVLGYHCTAYHSREDIFHNLEHIELLIQDIGTKPHWKVVEDDPVYMYAYGECFKGRNVNRGDLNRLVVALDGDCDDCVSWK